MASPEIDLVKYGVLWQKVEDYERRFDKMETKIDKLEASIDTLIGQANQGRGGLWMGIGGGIPFSRELGLVGHWVGKN